MDNEEVEVAKYFNQLTERDSIKLLHEVNQTLNPYASYVDLRKFPGNHPVTLLKKHFKNLCEMDYYVCEKSDGVRVMLYVCSINGIANYFLLDRKEAAYRIHSASRPSSDFQPSFYDGEIYIDVSEGKQYLVYGIFDTLIFEGKNVCSEVLSMRLGYACTFASKIGGILGTMSVVVKKMYKSYGFIDVYKNIPNLKHKNDGMIFTPVNVPYKPGRCWSLLKWKPAHLNTVDFVMHRKSGFDFVYDLLCYGKENKMVVFDYYIDFEKNEKINNCVAEFYYNNQKQGWNIHEFCGISGVWELHRIRKDKETPNNIRVVRNVMLSIKEEIEYDDLVTQYDSMRENWSMRIEASKTREVLSDKTKICESDNEKSNSDSNAKAHIN